MGVLVIASTQPTVWSTIKATIARHPAGAFLIFFYVTGWIFFLPALLGTSGFGLLAYDLPPQPSILLLTIVGLAGGAFLVTRLADGKDGVRELTLTKVRDSAVKDRLPAALQDKVINARLRSGKVESIDNYILTGREDGMVSFDESVRQLLRAGKITPEVAEQNVREPSMLGR